MGKRILVTGVTGAQGGATARALAERGFTVRGLTRNPESKAARALAADGIELARGDFDDASSLEGALQGVSGVYAVTEFFKNGVAKEVEHGKRLAELARAHGVEHFVLASVSAADRDTGIPHFDSKRAIELHVRGLGLPATILRPTIFMEDLTEKQYVPPASWGMMPKLVGPERKVQWIAVDDIGAAVSAVFSSPERFVGRDIALAGDELSMREAREVFAAVDGKRPFALPMPAWLFERLVSRELVAMWRWLSSHSLGADIEATRALVPGLRNMRSWLEAKRTRAGALDAVRA